MNNFQWTIIFRRKNISFAISRQLGTLLCNWNRCERTHQTNVWFIPRQVKDYSNDSERGRQLGKYEYKEDYSKDSEYGRQLGGFEYKEDVEGFKSMWRTPIIQKKGFWKSKFAIFGTYTFQGDLLRFNPDNYKYLSFRNFLRKLGMKKIIYDQKYQEERLNILGCDLAAAHFCVYRGGAVKFYHHNNWIKDDKNKLDYDDDLPNRYDPNYVIEAIDFSGSKVIYEGLKSIENLKKLKWLNFACCSYFDDFCLDRVSGEFGETLEYLDISYTDVSHRGLNALYRFQNLKTLKVNGFSGYHEFWITCQELKKVYPNLIIEGISDEFPIEIPDKMEVQ